jgi:hypothetical protein
MKMMDCESMDGIGVTVFKLDGTQQTPTLENEFNNWIRFGFSFFVSFCFIRPVISPQLFLVLMSVIVLCFG